MQHLYLLHYLQTRSDALIVEAIVDIVLVVVAVMLMSQFEQHKIDVTFEPNITPSGSDCLKPDLQRCCVSLCDPPCRAQNTQTFIRTYILYNISLKKTLLCQSCVYILSLYTVHKQTGLDALWFWQLIETHSSLFYWYICNHLHMNTQIT